MPESIHDFRVLEEDAVFDATFAVISRIWIGLDTPYQPDPRLAELTVGQRSIYAMTWIQAEVNNGGFDQLFFNSTGFLLPEAIEGAATLDAPEFHDVFASAAGTLGDPYPRDRAERQRRLDELQERELERLSELDRRFYELDASKTDGLVALFERYMEANPSEFFVDGTDLDRAEALLRAAREHLAERNFRKDYDRLEDVLSRAVTLARSCDADAVAGQAQSLLDQIPHFRPVR